MTVVCMRIVGQGNAPSQPVNPIPAQIPKKRKVEAMSEQIDHFSASQIDMFSMCGEAWRRRYVERDYRPPTTALIQGISFHKAPEVNNTQKIQTKTDLPVADLQDVAASEVEAKFSKGVMLDDEEATCGISKVKGNVKDIVVAMVPLYAESTRPIQPRSVETLQYLTHRDWSKPVAYRMDLETEDDWIVDYKTSKKRKTQIDADTNTGLTMYSLAFYAKNGRFPKRILLDNYVGYKTPAKQELKTDHLQLETTRQVGDFNVISRRIALIQQAINLNLFNPAPVGHWKCSAAYCEYFVDCAYMNTGRKAAAEKE